MPLTKRLLCASLLVWSAASCAPTADDATAWNVTARACPEGVRRSDRGEPIGLVSGHVRWCWPGEAHCYCDRDDDCYALDHYVRCTPPTPDAGVRDAAAADVRDAAADVRDAAADVRDAATDVRDASSPPASDTVAYAGTFSGATGLSRARLTVMGEARDVWVYAPASRRANAPLILSFHGTNEDGAVSIENSGARALADAEGVVVVAPTSRWFSEAGADYDHPGGNGTYWETRNANVDTNADLVLVRAAMVEARRRYNTDLDRVYAMGHSNGGFMAQLVSVALRDRIAAFAENSAGLVTCASRPACTFQGTAYTCAELARQTRWCNCAGAGLPAVIPTSGRRVPGYLSHGVQDPMVSVYYTCALASRLAAAGVPAQTYLWSGGHDLGGTFARRAWTFMSSYRRQ